MAAARILLVVLVVLAAFPAAAGSRTSDAAPNSDYALSVGAFVRPDHTDLVLKAVGAPTPTEFEKVQVKIRPVGDGDVDTTNSFDVAAPGGVATLRLPRLALLQRVEVQAHVKRGSQNVLRNETLVQYEQFGAVSSDHPRATKLGAEVLAAGGNAFDAAAAMAFELSVVQPSLAGIGGAAEMVVHVAGEGRDYAIVGRERAPAATEATMYDDQFFPSQTPPQIGDAQARVGLNGYSVGVPGMVRAVEVMLERWGTRPLAAALEQPIIDAEKGVDVGLFLQNQISAGRTRLLQPETVARFGSLKTGDPLVQQDLAETLRMIARDGSSAFYAGPVAQAIVEAQKKLAVGSNAIAGGQGRMTLADLASYDVDVRRASHLDYKGYDVYAAPPPTSGGPVLLESLGLLQQRFPMLGDRAVGYGFGTHQTLHAMIESLRLAFADRDMWIGDPAHATVPELQLLSAAYLHDRAQLMNEYPVRMPSPSVGPGNPLPYPAVSQPDVNAGDENGHTTHLSVIDSFGNVVSFTATVRDSFGSGIMVMPYGFVLNDSLGLFNMPSRKAPDPGTNNAAPNKRPMGSQTPTMILKNGEPVAATGTYGAEFIPSLVLNIVVDLIDHKQSLQEAVYASRIWGRVGISSPSAQSGLAAWNYAALGTGAPTIDQSCAAPAPSTDCQGEIEELRKIGHPMSRRPAAGDVVFGSLASVGVDPATFALVAAADDVRQKDATAVVVPRP